VASLAFDTGYLYKTRGELQNIADATALAAARSLGDVYTLANAYDDSINRPGILSTAQSVAQNNRAGGKRPITIASADLEIGIWNGSTFTVNSVQPNAVRATVRRDGTANGPVGTFFGRVLGVNTVDLSARATAALSGQSTAAAAGAVALASGRVNGVDCEEEFVILFTNQLADCAAWHNPSGAATDANIADIISSEITFHINAGDTLNFSVETLDISYAKAQDVYEAYSNAGKEWEMNVAVYEQDERCDGGNGRHPLSHMPVIGFVTVVVTGVAEVQSGEYEGYNAMFVEIKCKSAEESRGNSKYEENMIYTMGNIPSLVE
jgi:hypothetical protein